MAAAAPLRVVPAETEVEERVQRRKFTAAYKAKILKEAENASDGQIGALLRREGLYASHLHKWRKERELNNLEPKKRGRKVNLLLAENKKLQAKNAKLEKRLQQANAIIDLQKKNCSDSGRNAGTAGRREVASEIAAAADQKLLPVDLACDSLNMSRSTYYRSLKSFSIEQVVTRPSPPRALSAAEKQEVLAALHEDRFVDKAPSAVYAALLDEGRYLCSIRTMYRILKDNNEVRERRNQARHPEYKKPELLATTPNQVWSWDITKLKGPEKWTYYYLYVIIDIFSRYVVGWLIAPRENAELAEALITETCWRQSIEVDQLSIHSDRGSPMTSKVVAQLMADLGVTKSLSRPRVSNDNPYSEAGFKTLKYHPTFPAQFGCIEDARAFCKGFFDWYNNDHYHSGLALLTPETVHHGQAQERSDARQLVLSSAYKANPERFVNGAPMVLQLPKEVWINSPNEANFQPILIPMPVPH
ncbi:MAG: IS3 family transposase [Candidatus Obscuribacterales bacterium]|nr:IS3 family transposase [Candidatus Obscuribacterales bacterium]